MYNTYGRYLDVVGISKFNTVYGKIWFGINMTDYTTHRSYNTDGCLLSPSYRPVRSIIIIYDLRHLQVDVTIYRSFCAKSA